MSSQVTFICTAFYTIQIALKQLYSIKQENNRNNDANIYEANPKFYS